MQCKSISPAAAALATALLVSHSCDARNAQKKYDTGATDTEIKIGNIMPYSGPASAYGVIGKTEAAYFNMINAAGRHQRPQDQLHLLRRRLLRRRRRSSRHASWSRATKCC